MPYFIVTSPDNDVQWVKADRYRHAPVQGDMDVPAGYAGPLGGPIIFLVDKPSREGEEQDADVVMSLAPGSWKSIRRARPGWEEEQYEALTAPMTSICTCYHMRADHDADGTCLICQDCKGFNPAPQAMQEEWETMWITEIKAQARKEAERQQKDA